MKVRQGILDKINNPMTRNKIALKLGCGEQMVAIHLRRNLDNGRLTKMDALKAISEETGDPIDKILEESNAVNAA